MSRAGEVGLALALDAAVGEPPVRLHPVVWMGRLVDLLEARVLAVDGPHERTAGVVAAGAGALAVLAAARVTARLPWPLRAVVLWSLLSCRLLLGEVAAVERALQGGGLEAGRERVAWLVSRDTATLDQDQVRAAAVQTLAENLSDSIVATLWWWSVAGLEGAALHRWADTLDSRWGYRTGGWDRRGWGAARADDALAWAPARLTALAWRARLDAPLRREARRTPSPNGGWPMAAAALDLDVRLEKPGSYVLHGAGRAPDATTVPAALRSARRVLAVVAAVTVGLAAARDLAHRRAGGTTCTT